MRTSENAVTAKFAEWLLQALGWVRASVGRLLCDSELAYGAGRPELGHLGVYPLGPVEARDADPVVPVLHEVVPVERQKADRLQIEAP